MNESDTHRRNPPRTTSTKHRVFVSFLVLIVLGAGVSAIAWAVDGAKNRGHGPWGADGGPMMGRFIVRALDWQVDLNDEQKTAIEQITTDAEAEGRALRGELGTLRKDVAEMIQANGFIEDQVRMMVEAKSPQMVDLMMLRIRTMAEIHALLTPEQQAEVKAFMADRRGSGPRRHRHRHRHGLDSPTDP